MSYACRLSHDGVQPMRPDTKAFIGSLWVQHDQELAEYRDQPYNSAVAVGIMENFNGWLEHLLEVYG